MESSKTKEIIEDASPIRISARTLGGPDSANEKVICHAIGCDNRPTHKLQLLVRGRTILLSLCSTCVPKFVPNPVALSCSTTPVSTLHEVILKVETK